ncbi:hypothetical protein [Aquimarina aggregata]|uniref:hypothetical protein n=1 Tax=Aquimarina aggregata TaxID=1642818 RepID=UPI0024915496|nr:hypothetical protein [Aquimarina aggregata]
MKNIFKKALFICLSMVLILACTTNDYEEPENTTAGRAFGINSFDRGRRGETIDVRVGTSEVEFRDLSILASGRTWTFPEGAVDILGSDNDTTTDLEVFSVTFRRTGPVDVLLEPVFDGPVPDEVATETFTFNALDQIAASFSVDLPIVNNAFQVEAGTEVTFTNTSTETESAEWRVINTTTGREEDLITTTDLVFQFKALGEYIVGLRAFDDAPFSSSISAVQVRVIPSSQPLVPDTDIDENEAGQIILKYSRDLDVTTLDPISSFTLTVDGAPATITSVAIDPDNLSNIIITPEVNIKNTQTATLAYTVTSLTSTDAATAESLPETAINAFTPNLFVLDPTFEEGPIQWGTPFGNNTDGVVRELVSPGNNSNNAMGITVNTDTNAQVAIGGAVELKAGSRITLKFDYLLPTTWTGGEWNTRMYPAGAFNDDFRTFHGTCCGLIADGEWHTRTVPLVGSGGAGTVVSEDMTVSFFLQIIANTSADTQILFDNFVVESVEE